MMLHCHVVDHIQNDIVLLMNQKWLIFLRIHQKSESTTVAADLKMLEQFVYE